MNEVELHTKINTLNDQIDHLCSYFEMERTSPCLFVFLLKSLSGWSVWELDLIDVYHWKQRY